MQAKKHKTTNREQPENRQGEKKMTIAELKKEAEKCERFLEITKTGKYAKRAKNRLSQIKDQIFKIEDPALYKSYLDAEKAFFSNTHVF